MPERAFRRDWQEIGGYGRNPISEQVRLFGLAGLESCVSATMVLRDELGHVLLGSATPNKEGRNQFSPDSKQAVLRRLEKAVLRKLSHPLCVETLSQNWANALMCPDLAPVTARIAGERIYPSNGLGNGEAPDEPESLSEGQRLRFAQLFDREIPPGTRLAAPGDAERSVDSEVP